MTASVESSKGATLIGAERQRQIEQEGWTPEHDDGHTLSELAVAGACYALQTTRWRDSSALVGGRLVRDILWPWEPEWWKPAQYPEPPYDRNVHRDKHVKDLVRAGALIAAEIDRLLRASTPARVSTSDEPDVRFPGPTTYTEACTCGGWENGYHRQDCGVYGAADSPQAEPEGDE